MKVLILSMVLFLTACSTTPVPVERDFPEVPKELLDKPEPLQEIPDSAPSSKVIEIVIQNYGEYHKIALRLNAWQKWYSEQKVIYEAD